MAVDESSNAAFVSRTHWLAWICAVGGINGFMTVLMVKLLARTNAICLAPIIAPLG